MKEKSELFLRVSYALLFMLAGLGHLLNFDMTIEGARIISNWVGLGEMEVAATILAVSAIVFLILGSLSLTFGFRARWGSTLIVLFLLPATALHTAVMQIAANNAITLTVESSEKAKQTLQSLINIAIQGHQGNFVKNLFLIVVGIYFIVVGAGPISIDARRKGS